jgi:hypothetical protein
MMVNIAHQHGIDFDLLEPGANAASMPSITCGIYPGR